MNGPELMNEWKAAIRGLERENERLWAEIERLRAERNLAVEILQSAERELAAELERCAQLRDAAQGLLSAVGYDRKDMIDEAADKLAAELAAERERCARIAESGDYNPYPAVGAVIAAAIRKGEP